MSEGSVRVAWLGGSEERGAGIRKRCSLLVVCGKGFERTKAVSSP